MVEKLKYKVGDRILFEVVVSEIDVEDTEAPYYLSFGDDHGLWATEEELETLFDRLPPKPKIPQAVMDWYFKFQENYWDVEMYLVDEPKPNEVDKWLYTGNRQLNSERQHALATLIAYGPEAVEVEKEKKYRVVFKSSGQVLSKVNDHILDEVYFMFLHSKLGVEDMCYPKQELIDAGFGDVFDNEMFKVEEVE